MEINGSHLKFQCENGHYFCNGCYEPLKKEGKDCPVCQGRLTKSRNLAVEKMLEKLPKIKCRYEDCQFKRADIDVVYQHETDCVVECIYCEEGIPVSKLSDHLEVAHRLKPKTPANLGIEKALWSADSGLHDIQGPLKCHDLTFFINRKLYNDELIMFWISFCGDQKEAEKYEYTIKIESSADKNAGRTKYLFTGSRQCVSCDVSHKDMMKEAEALFISNKLLMKAAEGHDGKRLEYKLIIVKQQ